MGTLVPRSERAEDLERLVRTFVDCGVIDIVDNTKNQIIYGRRGTGKTHVLRYLESRYRQAEDTVVSYIDARTLGSSTIFTDTERSMHSRFVGLYKDVVSQFHNALFEKLAAEQSGDVDRALNALSEIERQLSYSEAEKTDVRVREAESSTEGGSTGLNARVSASGPSVTGALESKSVAATESEIESSASFADKLVFPPLFDAFQAATEAMHLKRFVVLLDEWSSVPPDLQPYLAELLNRVFFANPKVTFKIASLEFRTKFVVFDESGRRVAGLELGGDIETAVDLDDFYVYDRDPAGTETLFGDLLHRHMLAAFDEQDYLEKTYGTTSPSDFIDLFFTDQAFKELVRAAEGVARDLLQVFTRAYTNAWKADGAHITVPAVTSAARDWYESDKQSNLSESQHQLLRGLIEDVIAGRARFWSLEKTAVPPF